MTDHDTQAGLTYPTWKRATVYLCVVCAVSVLVGVAATSVTDAWRTMSLVDAGRVGLVGFGPMGLVLALSPTSRRATGGLAALLAAAVVACWIAFASNDSSTSSMVFAWAWIAGVPLAAAAGAVFRNAERGRPTFR